MESDKFQKNMIWFIFGICGLMVMLSKCNWS